MADSTTADTGADAEADTRRHRLVVSYLPRFCNAKTFKNIIFKLKVANPKKMKFVNTVGFVSFDSRADFDAAMTAINGADVKGKKLKAEEAPVKEDNFRSNRGAPRPTPTKETMLAAVQPFAAVAYDEQLAGKRSKCDENLRSLGKAMRAAGCDMSELDDVLKPMLPSPKLTAYRNKCELSIGYTTSDPSTRQPIVGFVHGRRDDDNRQIVWPCDDCVLMPETMKRCVNEFQSMLRSPSSSPIYDEPSKSGVYRMLTVRTFDIDLMIIVTITAKEGDEVSKTVKEEILAHFGDDATADDGGQQRDSERQFHVTSIYISHIINSSDVPNYEHIYEAPYIYARLFKHRFRLSPDAFFQPNVECAETLYMTIGDMLSTDVRRNTPNNVNDAAHDAEPAAKLAKVDDASTEGDKKKTLLLDICCGTGTIGISLANQVDAVVGAEICKQAVFDARENATINGVGDKCRFVCGPAEDTFRDLKYYLPTADGAPKSTNLDDWNVVGVVDPPRAGLHSKLVQALRHTTSMRTIVFSSCDPAAAMANFVNLCRPTSNNWSGDPFKIRSIVPVDMFPQTRHYEWVLLFTR